MFFFIFLSIMVYYRILNIVPMFYSRTLLFIHPLCNSLYLPTSNSRCFPPLPQPPCPWQPHPFSMSVSLFCCSTLLKKKKKVPLRLHILYFHLGGGGSCEVVIGGGGRSAIEASLEWAFWDSVQTLSPEA